MSEGDPTGPLQRVRDEVAATYDVLYGVVHALVERGTRLRDLAQSSDDLERASDILRSRSRRARFSRRQLSPAEFALGLVCENARIAFCTTLVCLAVVWFLAAKIGTAPDDAAAATAQL